MKKLTLLLLALFSLQIGFSQKLNIKSSKEYKLKTWPIELIGEIEGNIYTVAQKGADFTLQKNNESLNFIKSEEINLRYKKNLSFYLESIIISNKIYIFVTIFDSKTKKQLLLYQEYSVNTLKPEGDWNILYEINKSTSINYNAFMISLSDNKEKVLVSAELAVKSINKTSVSVFNSKFEKLWSNDNILNRRNQKSVELTEQLISNEGVVYTLTKNYKKDRDNVINKKIAFNFSILQIEKEKEIIQYPIKLDKGLVIEAKIIFDNNKDIICGGAYTINQKPYNHSGTFFYKIDHKQNINTIITTNEYSFDFRMSLFDKGDKKKALRLKKKGKTLELDNAFNITELEVTEDNSIILVTECQYTTKYTSTSSSGTVRYYNKYHVENLIAIDYNTDGTLKWTRKIPLLHHSKVQEYVSYYMAKKKNSIYFFYNDNVVKDRVKFETKNNTQVIFSRKTLLACTQIKSDGNVKYYPLKKAKGTNYHFIPMYSMQLQSSDDIIIYSKLAKKQYLLKISIDD